MEGGGGVQTSRGPIAAAPIAAVLAIAFFNASNLGSHLAQTSDSVQGFVVGHAIAAGNFLLSGWHFPIDDFYFTDSLPYGVAEWMTGPRLDLLTLVPAVVYTLVILLAFLASFQRRETPRGRLESSSAIVVFLAAPVWIGAWNPMLMSDMHMATVLAALGALMLCARLADAEAFNNLSRILSGCVFVVLVCLTVASDPFILIFAFGPAAAVLAAESVRDARRPRGWVPLLLLAAGIVAGLLLPTAIAAIGGFSTENDVSFQIAPVTQWRSNLVAALVGILTLGGANPVDVSDALSAAAFAIHFVGFAMVLSAMIWVASDLFRKQQVPLFDRLMLSGTLVSICACIPSAQFAKGVRPEEVWHAGPSMRFLVPAVLFAAILSSRQIGRTLDAARTPKKRTGWRNALALLAGIVLLTGLTQSFAERSRAPWTSSNPALTVARWLKRHDLSEGTGEYWSANLLTAMSGNAIVVRSVVPEGHKLSPYIWVEDRGFYATAPQFVVWQDPNQTEITENRVRATYPVCAVIRMGNYRIAPLKALHNLGPCS